MNGTLTSTDGRSDEALKYLELKKKYQKSNSAKV
jgi:hypothetical protein